MRSAGFASQSERQFPICRDARRWIVGGHPSGTGQKMRFGDDANRWNDHLTFGSYVFHMKIQERRLDVVWKINNLDKVVCRQLSKNSTCAHWWVMSTRQSGFNYLIGQFQRWDWSVGLGWVGRRKALSPIGSRWRNQPRRILWVCDYTMIAIH